jgi:hypothetical protein
MGEIEAAVDDIAAHDQLQGEAVFCHDLTHLCVMTHFELSFHCVLLAVYVCIIAPKEKPVNPTGYPGNDA